MGTHSASLIFASWLPGGGATPFHAGLASHILNSGSERAAYSTLRAYHIASGIETGHTLGERMLPCKRYPKLFTRVPHLLWLGNSRYKNV